jgi:hypothetical protein
LNLENAEMWSPPVVGPVARRRVLLGRAGRHSPIAAWAGIIRPCRKRKPAPCCPNAHVSRVRSSLRCQPPSHMALLLRAGPAMPRRPPFLPTGRSGLPQELTLPALRLVETPSHLQTELPARVHRVVPLLLSTRPSTPTGIDPTSSCRSPHSKSCAQLAATTPNAIRAVDEQPAPLPHTPVTGSRRPPAQESRCRCPTRQSNASRHAAVPWPRP